MLRPGVHFEKMSPPPPPTLQSVVLAMSGFQDHAMERRSDWLGFGVPSRNACVQPGTRTHEVVERARPQFGQSFLRRAQCLVKVVVSNGGRTPDTVGRHPAR